MPEIRIDSKQQFIFLASSGATIPATFTYRGKPFQIVKRDARTELVERPQPERRAQWVDFMDVVQTNGLKSPVGQELTEAFAIAQDLRDRVDVPPVMPVDLGGKELEKIVRSGVSLAGRNVRHARLHDADLSGTDFRGTCFEHCNLKEVNLRKSNLEGCRFIDCQFDEVDFALVQANGARFERCSLRDVYLNAGDKDGEECWLSSASFEACSLERVSFYRAHLERASFLDCAMHTVIFDRTVATDTIFRGLNVQTADRCKLLQEQHGGAIGARGNKGISFQFAQFDNALFEDCDLGGLSLTMMRGKVQMIRVNIFDSIALADKSRYDDATLESIRGLAFYPCKSGNPEVDALNLSYIDYSRKRYPFSRCHPAKLRS